MTTLASALVCAFAVAGCWLPPRTWHPSTRPLVAASGRALVVVFSSATPSSQTWPAYPSATRILDANAEAVADVPDGDCAVFDAAPGEHVFAAFTLFQGMPMHGGSVGALRATLGPDRTYVFRVDRSALAGGWQHSEVILLVDLVAVRGADVPGVLAQLRVEPRVELLPKELRPVTMGDDLDVREAVVGLAKLRVSEDDPRLSLPEPLRSLVPRAPPWSPARSTLEEVDGASLPSTR